MRKGKAVGQIVAVAVLCLWVGRCTLDRGARFSVGEATVDESLEEARRLFGRAEYEEVINLCTQTIAAHPEAAAAYVLRGATHTSKNDLDRAAADFEKGIELSPDYASAYTGRGRLNELRHFRKWNQLARQSSDEKRRELRAKALAIPDDALEDYQRAIELCTTALQTDAQNAKAYVSRGDAHCVKREYNQAIRDYTRALEIRPDDAWTYVSRGLAYVWQKDYDRAIEDYSKAVEIEPRFAEAYHVRGQAYLSKLELQQAIEDYDKTLEINPQHAVVYSSRAFAHMAAGEYAQSQEDLQKARELYGASNVE